MLEIYGHLFYVELYGKSLGVAVEVAMWVAEDTMLNCHHLLVLQAFTFLMAQLACLPVIEA